MSSSPVATWLSELAHFIRHSDPVAVGIAIGLLAAACVYCSWRTWRLVGHIRLIQDTPTARIRSAPQGYVELEGVGRLMDGAPIIAKLSGLPCVWYRFKIEKKVTSHDHRGHASTQWELVDSGESTETFWLEDATGRVVIDPEGAQINARHQDTWRSHSSFGGIARPDYVTKFVATHHSSGNYRLTEQRLNLGEPLYALGLLKSVSSYTRMPTVEEDARELLKEWKRDQAGLKARFDLNKDGAIDEIEWRLARAQARREVRKSRQEVTATFIDGLNVMGPTHDLSRPYILSAFTQTELTKRYTWWSAFYAIACFVFGLASVWVFNARFP